jgi:hypothetical protein
MANRAGTARHGTGTVGTASSRAVPHSVVVPRLWHGHGPTTAPSCHAVPRGTGRTIMLSRGGRRADVGGRLHARRLDAEGGERTAAACATTSGAAACAMASGRRPTQRRRSRSCGRLRPSGAATCTAAARAGAARGFGGSAIRGRSSGVGGSWERRAAAAGVERGGSGGGEKED